MFNMLVEFTKYNGDVLGEVVDIQYHYFTNCKDRFSFLDDPIYKTALSKGYKWSSIDFPYELAAKCGFTMSDCEANV